MNTPMMEQAQNAIQMEIGPSVMEATPIVRPVIMVMSNGLLVLLDATQIQAIVILHKHLSAIIEITLISALQMEMLKNVT
jgi:hypothetical protein